MLRAQRSREAQITFTGTRFILTYAKHSSYGWIDVYVDGTKITTTDTYNATTLYQQTYTSPDYSLGNHTVRLVHAGDGTYIDIDAIEIYAPPIPPVTAVTIEYDYDPLYRLTAADYSNGDYYHYTYDAVGNRLTQQKSIIGLVTTDTYVYDDANRLTSVDNVPYTWDPNGNLSNDGVNDYQYDAANRLISISGSVTATYAYNGLGDRLRETTNGHTTAFTMDLNMGLTQALNDGTNNYIYGNGRIAQVNTGTEYFLGDALGSVRQLTNNSGAITYASAYDPYGVTTQTYGASQTAYGYTGEYTDSYIKLIYLRSRLYDPQTGRFTTRDSWQGDYNRPLSLNRWMYVEGNPINYSDPTGFIKETEAGDANDIVRELKIYHVFVQVDWGGEPSYYSPIDPTKVRVDCKWNDGEWTLWELTQLRKGVIDTSRAMGGYNAFVFNYGYIKVEKRLLKDDPLTTNNKARGIAHLLAVNSLMDNEANNWSIVHELGHVWDGNTGGKLSDGLVTYTKKHGTTWVVATCDNEKRLPGCNDDRYVYYDVLASGADHNMNKLEDFANSFVAYVYPVDSQGRIEKYAGTKYDDYLYYTDYTTTWRWKYIDDLVHSQNVLRKR